MEIFFTLFLKIIPLYLIIALGFIAGKVFGVKKEYLATLLIYIITPIVVFHGVFTTNLTAGALSLPVAFFVLGVILSLLFYSIGKKIWADSTKNILAFTAGTGNTGYFGLPVALAILGPSALGLAVLATLGVVLFENTLGFYLTARGQYTGREAFKKLLGLPSLYTFFLAVIINLLRFHPSQSYIDFADSFKGAYTVLGMMIVGLGIADISKIAVDKTFTALAFAAKFIAWPLGVTAIIILDRHYFHLFTPAIYQIMLVMSIVPMAANTVAYASQLNAQPQKAAVAVLLSTLFALIYIPIVVSIFILK